MKKLNTRDAIKEGIRQGKYPERLYKYRTLESAIRSLKGPSFYASSILDFNDPYEGHFVLDPINTQQEWEDFLHREDPKMSQTEITAHAHQLATNPIEERNLIEPIIHKELQDTGVYCLSKNWDSIPTWAYYSEDHKGIVIEYDPLQDAELCDALLPVIYSDNYIKFNYLRHPQGCVESIKQKAKSWSHEEEYRVIKPKKANQVIFIKPQSITSIILGCRFEHGIKNNPKRQALLRELVDILRDPKYNHLQIKQCIQKPDKYELTTKMITLPMLEALLPSKKCIFGNILTNIKKMLHLK